MNQETRVGARARSCAKDADRAAVSRRHSPPTICKIGREGEGGRDVVVGQLGKIVEDLRPAHTRGEPAEDITDGDPHAANAGLPAAFSRFDRDDLSVVHKEA